MPKKRKMMSLKSVWEKAGKAVEPIPTSPPRAAPASAPEPPSILLHCLRFILGQGLAFRGDDEIECSLSEGNLLELLKCQADNLKGADEAALRNALDDPQMNCPKMVKDLVNACARETSRLIREDLGEDNFAILTCAFSDACHNEQLAVCLRYVDKKGWVVERFLGVLRVENLNAPTVKAAIDSLLRDHSLSWSRVCGQGYDGIGRMRAYVKDLKKIIMDEYPSAHCVHFFAQELHLALVEVLKENDACADFFEQLGLLVSVLEFSCRKPQMLQVAEAQRVLEEMDKKKACRKGYDYHYGFHYKTIIQIVVLYPTIRSVLIIVGEGRTEGAEAVNARTILVYLESFEFVFMLNFLLKVLGITATLHNSLLMRDQFVVNGIEIIDISKHLRDELRGPDGWEKILKDVTKFCAEHEIKIPSMDDIYEPVLRSKGFFRKVKNLHRYHVEIFRSIIDRQIQEFNDRFDEVNTDFLLCVASLDPANSFMPYKKDKLLRLACFYPKDFSSKDLLHLPSISHTLLMICVMMKGLKKSKVLSSFQLCLLKQRFGSDILLSTCF